MEKKGWRAQAFAKGYMAAISCQQRLSVSAVWDWKPAPEAR